MMEQKAEIRTSTYASNHLQKETKIDGRFKCKSINILGKKYKSTWDLELGKNETKMIQ